jgi:thiol-disulfide isomerase/thioredoxin
LTEGEFHQVVGQGKYVFLDLYSKGCVWCYRFVPEFNKLVDFFAIHRKDIIFAKLEGPKFMNLARRFRVRYYPTVMLFRPHDSRYPIKYEGSRSFEEVKQFLKTYPKVGASPGANIEPIQLEKMCKPNVDKAVEIFERDVRASGLLISPEDLKYYSSMV